MVLTFCKKINKNPTQENRTEQKPCHKTGDDLDRQLQLRPYFLSDFVSDYLQQHPKDDFALFVSEDTGVRKEEEERSETE